MDMPCKLVNAIQLEVLEIVGIGVLTLSLPRVVFSSSSPVKLPAGGSADQ